MVRTTRVAAAQTLERFDAIDEACAEAIQLVGAAMESKARLVCFPEGYLQGYRTDAAYVEKVALPLNSAVLQNLVDRLPANAPAVVLGFIEAVDSGFANSAVIIQGGKLLGCYRKANLLASETVFTAGETFPTFELDGLKFGVSICNDANFATPAKRIGAKGASLLVCCSNNMLPRDIAEKWKMRHNEIRGERCRETGLWLLSSDVTGEREGFVGLGPTSILNPEGRVIAQLPLHRPGLLIAELTV